MKILQVTPRYFPNIGGVETVVKKISEMLVERGFQVTVYSMDLGSRTEKIQRINGVLVKRFKPIIGDPLYIPPPIFLERIKKENANIIHVHNAHTTILTFVAISKRKNQNLVIQPHYHKFGQTLTRNFLFNLYKYPLNRLVFPRSEFIITNSAYERKIVHEDFPTCKNIILIPEGIALAEIKSVRWSPEKPTRILYVGALRKYKKVSSLLKAFEHIIKVQMKSYRLVIIGDGPERDHLMSCAHQFGVEKYVEWERNLPRKQLLNEYAKAGVFVSLSRLESFSRVIHEAILIGVPSVVQNYGATATIARAGLAEGVDSLNPETIAKAILKVERRKPQKNSEIFQLFLSWNEYVDKILDIYKKM